MTDNEIIKVLECCKTNNCDECPFYGVKEDCEVELPEEALDLINRQKAEIERLKKNFDGLNIFTNNYIKAIKSETRQEFVERLKLKLRWDTEFENTLVFETDIDNLVKEMTEVSE